MCVQLPFCVSVIQGDLEPCKGRQFLNPTEQDKRNMKPDNYVRRLCHLGLFFFLKIIMDPCHNSQTNILANTIIPTRRQ